MINKPIKPMLLQKSDTVPQGDYIHQMKFDGHRALLHYQNGCVRIFTRHGNECTSQYPEMQNLKLNADECILDGEMIVLDENGKPCFDSVMERFLTKNPEKRFQRVHSLPAHFVAFDNLLLNGKNVMYTPLEARLGLLNEVVTSGNIISVCPTFEDGNMLYDNVVQQSLEGIVSKRKSSRYQLDYRSESWVKIKNYQYETVQISGIRKKDFGWSLVKDGRYVGITEFVPSAERQAFHSIYKQLVVKEDSNWIHLVPQISCKVKFQCYTKKGYLRSPSVMGFVL
ncbi:RNA ligase family protein [Paenibacillus sp. GP183]|uniref:ATP-dependent DNA ligase n=1 Tax=Paenibacillus sp. GP183 TaxID=1882751 RepID=UPI00089AA7FA|nr:RNA ligase family protein [Paenibacillus sp. GP183]SEB93543.1 DNA ligase-1 [Paenibacillus sp. GP183]